jgi:hypothetical protein
MRNIYFVANGSTEATKAAYRAGARIGFESSNTRPPSTIPVDFVDWPFKQLSTNDAVDVFSEYIQTVYQERPTIAVIPDINGDISTEQVFEWAYRIDKYCDTMIIVPKSIHPSLVPENLRVGIPCQSKFADQPWEPADYRNCAELHLLGGSPHIHYDLIYRHGLTQVESIDTSVPIQSARWGDVWQLENGDPYWSTDNLGVYGCVEASFRNMCVILNRDRDSVPCERLYVERPDRGKYQSCGYPDDDLLHPNETRPFPGREYYTRMTYHSFPND